MKLLSEPCYGGLEAFRVNDGNKLVKGSDVQREVSNGEGDGTGCHVPPEFCRYF